MPPMPEDRVTNTVADALEYELVRSGQIPPPRSKPRPEPEEYPEPEPVYYDSQGRLRRYNRE